MIRLKRIIPILIACIAAGLTAPTTMAQSSRASQLELEQAILRAFDAKAYERAESLIERYLGEWPGTVEMLYNLACARCHLGERDEAASALYQSVEAGFRQFDQMQRDPDLEPIRTHPVYLAILEAAARTQADSADDIIARWKRLFGAEGYRFETDDARRLVYATALDATAHREMRAMIERQADQMARDLFDGMPSYYVLIAVPTPKHAALLFGGDDAVGGRYEHAQRRLIARDTGGSIRHELVHLLHYGHMERLGLTKAHPLWIQEGIAALYEDYDWVDGRPSFRPNERHNIVRNLVRRGRPDRWSHLFGLSAEQFMRRPNRHYPEARSIFEFIADQGHLVAWYRAYVARADEDPTGAKTFEAVFERPLDEIEQAWRAWVRSRPAVDYDVDPGDASLGVEVELNGSNDGILITRVLPGRSGPRGRLRRGDVVVSIDGASTRSLPELYRVLGMHQVGDRVTVRIRRDDRYLSFPVVLRARP